MRLLLIDNFDSFVFNLYQYFLELGCSVEVVRNNELSVKQIKEKKFDAIVISPGPGHPSSEKDFGVCSKVIKELSPTVPILGVCLGCFLKVAARIVVTSTGTRAKPTGDFSSG